MAPKFLANSRPADTARSHARNFSQNADSGSVNGEAQGAEAGAEKAARRCAGKESARRAAASMSELKAIGRNPEIVVAVRVRAPSKAGELEAKARSARARKLGKKEIATAEAETAGEGTDWGDDLNVPPTKPKR
jgi:hypothetical protein